MEKETVKRQTNQENDTHTLCRELAEGLGGSLDYMVKEDNAQVEKTMPRLRQE